MLSIALLLDTAYDAVALAWQPVANARFFAFVLVVSFLIAAIGIMNRRRPELGAAERDASGSMLLLAVALLLWGLTQETYETCRFYQHVLGPNWTRAAQMAISLVWTLSGALLLIGGIVRGYRPVRLAALGLLGLTVLKVFLFDLSFLDTPLRILSFGGLGLALIFISWLYSRYGVGHEAAAQQPPTDGGG